LKHSRKSLHPSRVVDPPHVFDGVPQLKTRWESYRGLFRRAEFPAKATLLREGEIPSKVFSVEKGCLRTAIDRNGKDITTQFFFENDVVASIESFRSGRPSPISILSVEPSTIVVLPKKGFEILLRDFPEMKDLLLELALRRFEAYSRLFASYLTLTPRQRYLALIKSDPRIIARVPQHYVASYLGITPVSLSRIRKRVQSHNA
jgi:CRP-like cAMP-binding protein